MECQEILYWWLTLPKALQKYLYLILKYQNKNLTWKQISNLEYLTTQLSIPLSDAKQILALIQYRTFDILETKFTPLIQKWKTLPENLQHYLQLFITNDLTLEKISMMSETALKNLGISNGLHLNQIKILLVHGHETALSFSNLNPQQTRQNPTKQATHLNFASSYSQNDNLIENNRGNLNFYNNNAINGHSSTSNGKTNEFLETNFQSHLRNTILTEASKNEIQSSNLSSTMSFDGHPIMYSFSQVSEPFSSSKTNQNTNNNFSSLDDTSISQHYSQLNLTNEIFEKNQIIQELNKKLKQKNVMIQNLQFKNQQVITSKQENQNLKTEIEMIKSDNTNFRNKAIILEQKSSQLENKNLNLNQQLNEITQLLKPVA